MPRYSLTDGTRWVYALPLGWPPNTPALFTSSEEDACSWATREEAEAALLCADGFHIVPAPESDVPDAAAT